MEDEKIQFEEARLLAEEISRKNGDYVPSEEDEILTLDEEEQLIKGE